MSKNNKGRSAKVRAGGQGSFGKGVRAFRGSLHMGTLGGDSFIYTDRVPLHTPPVQERVKQKNKYVNIIKRVNEEKIQRQGTLQRMRNVVSGKVRYDSKDPAESRIAEMRVLRREIERPGYAQYTGSNRHDRAREVPEEPEVAETEAEGENKS